MVEARLRVIYGDTDQMGVVYYANYFRYFEAARGELIRSRGGSYRDVEAQGLTLPVVEAGCSYKSPARYDDVLVIKTQVELRGASMRFTYELFKDGEDKLLCSGHTVHACLGKDGRPTRLPDSLLKLLQES